MVVPLGSETVPVAMVKLLLTTSVEVENDQALPTPLKVKLLKADAPRAILPVVVPINVTVPDWGINELLFVQAV